MVLLPNDASLGMLLKVVVIKREVTALALNCGCGKRGTFSHSSLGQEATSQSDHAFGAIILAMNPWVWSSKSSSSSVKSKRLLLTVPVESGGRLAILCSDRTQQFKSDRTFGVITLAIK